MILTVLKKAVGFERVVWFVGWGFFAFAVSKEIAPDINFSKEIALAIDHSGRSFQ